MIARTSGCWRLRDDLLIMLAFSDLSSKKFVGEKGAPEPATPTADRRYSTPQTTPSHRASQPPGHPPPTATDPTQSACAEVEFCARTSLSQPAAAASRRPGTPLGPALLPRSPPRPPPPVVCPPGGGRRRPVASSAVLPLVRPPATVGSNVDLLPGCRGMRAGMPVAGLQLAYVGIRPGCEPASSTVSGGTGVRSSALHARAGRAGGRARASCSSPR